MRSKLSFAATALAAAYAGAGVHSTSAAGTGCRNVYELFRPQQTEVLVCACGHGIESGVTYACVACQEGMGTEIVMD